MQDLALRADPRWGSTTCCRSMIRDWALRADPRSRIQDILYSHPQSIIIKTVNKIAHNPLSSMMRVKLLTQNVLFPPDDHSPCSGVGVKQLLLGRGEGFVVIFHLDKGFIGKVEIDLRFILINISRVG